APPASAPSPPAAGERVRREAERQREQGPVVSGSLRVRARLDPLALARVDALEAKGASDVLGRVAGGAGGADELEVLEQECAPAEITGLEDPDLVDAGRGALVELHRARGGRAPRLLRRSTPTNELAPAVEAAPRRTVRRVSARPVARP